VAVLISNALLFFLLGVNQSQSQWRTALLLISYIFAGLAFLTKGLIGLVFPAMIIGTWIFVLNRWHLLKKIHLFSGIGIFILLVVPWYYFVQKANPQFLHFFFVTQQVTRFLTKATFNSQAAFWFYVPVLLAGFIPWSLFVIQAIVYHLKRIWQNHEIYSQNGYIRDECHYRKYTHEKCDSNIARPYSLRSLIPNIH